MEQKSHPDSSEDWLVKVMLVSRGRVGSCDGVQPWFFPLSYFQYHRASR